MTGLCLLASRRAREAERYLAQASDFDKENTLVLWTSGLALMTRGQAAEGIETLTRALTPSHRGGFIHALLSWAFAVAGHEDRARAVLDELRMAGAQPSANLAEAWLLAALGEADGAWAILDRAEQTCQQSLLLVGLPGFDPLRADRRFAVMLERLGSRPRSRHFRRALTGEPPLPVPSASASRPGPSRRARQRPRPSGRRSSPARCLTASNAAFGLSDPLLRV